MKPLPIDSCEPRARDLIERIASALPPHVRADYYREMAYCRVLPESDEMLRILRVMQFLTLLIEQAPLEVAAEREKLARLLGESVDTVCATHESAMAYLRTLEDRILHMPQEVADGIRPQIIAQMICEDLRTRFADIPQTVQTLAATSRMMKDASVDFQRTASQLTGSYAGVAQSAKLALNEMQESLNRASETARGATRELLHRFTAVQQLTMAAICTAALISGLAMGVLIDQWIRPAAPPAAPTQAVAPARPAER